MTPEDISQVESRIEGGEALEQSIHSEEFEPFSEDTPDPNSEGGGSKPTEGEESLVEQTAPPSDTKPATDTPENDTSDLVYDVPGLGHIRASDIRGLHAQQSVYKNLQTEQQKLETEREKVQTTSAELSEAIELQKLLNYGDVRSTLQKALGDLFSSDDVSATPDGNSKDFLATVTGRTQPDGAQANGKLESEVQELKEYIGKIQEDKTTQEVDKLFNGYSEKFPEVVTQGFKDQVMDKAIEAYADNGSQLGIEELNNMIGASVLEAVQTTTKNGLEMAEALKAQPPGTRLVTGQSNRKSAAPSQKSPLKMDWNELEAEGGESFFVEDGA